MLLLILLQLLLSLSYPCSYCYHCIDGCYTVAFGPPQTQARTRTPELPTGGGFAFADVPERGDMAIWYREALGDVACLFSCTGWC